MYEMFFFFWEVGEGKAKLGSLFHCADSLFLHFLFYWCCSVDDGFPDIKFHFENSLSLTVYPHEYLFQIRVSKLNLILLLIIAFIIVLKIKNYSIYNYKSSIKQNTQLIRF